MKPHAVMFHHFHDESKHPKVQGSISAERLDNMIQFLQANKVILSANEWLYKALQDKLKENEICLSFDDNLRCQFDIAYPILKKYNLKVFWFVYTSPLEGKLERLEIYRYFRTVYFENIDDFYHVFFDYIEESDYKFRVSKALEGFIPQNYLSDFSFYTDNDRTFRYIRDQILGPDDYRFLMDAMLKDYKVDLKSLRKKLWISKENIKELHNKGHMIGLHTHTHPTSIASLDINKQTNEYQINMKLLSEILGDYPVVMSHPCNSYNKNTIKLLKELKIKLGFRSNMKNNLNSMYEFPREDHANIIREMEQKS
ncbi:polysaccharide deacetylase family protein [Selenihalanaerobacter shriftii]|uniref:Polysaccharide deacetylase n=1 Tax=Selenihalanaerobacter shriftii TaxID=142842 RepID=A0A1T4KN06_9FIRM|nr:polysaccharide deacetylase family protein [Selenihalanaerobacter shriftii]SJZ43822.1 Polysaccharide deacetylase [Selenihalanaerobacter shriftii]